MSRKAAEDTIEIGDGEGIYLKRKSNIDYYHMYFRINGEAVRHSTKTKILRDAKRIALCK